MIIHKVDDASSKNASLYAITFGCLYMQGYLIYTYCRAARILTSFMAFDLSFSFSFYIFTYTNKYFKRVILVSKHIQCCHWFWSLGRPDWRLPRLWKSSWEIWRLNGTFNLPIFFTILKSYSLLGCSVDYYSGLIGEPAVYCDPRLYYAISISNCV